MLVINILLDSKGGAEDVARNIFKFTQKSIYDSYIIYINNTKKLKLKKNEILINKFKYSVNVFSYIKTFLTIYKLSKGHSKVILHSHLFPIFYFIPLFKIFRKFILIHTEHNVNNARRKYLLFKKYFIFKKIEKFIYKQFSLLVAVSDDAKFELQKWLNNEENEKLTVIYNGAKLFSYFERTYDYEKFKIISIGRLIPQKGFDIAIKAINEVRDNVESYTILGSGKDRQYLERLIEKYRLEEKVNLIGFKENILHWIKKSNLGLIPSRYEGFSLASIEMISTGLPIISSNCIGLSHLNELPSVIPVKKLSHIEIAKTIKKLSKTKLISERNRKKSSILVQKYNIIEMVKNYDNLYKKCFLIKV